MSILIKGIDLPKVNEIRMIAITSNGVVFFTTVKDGEKSKSEKTEAIQIPTPHGRIIDADLFKEIIKDSVPAWTIGVKIPTYGDMDIMDKIYYIPTILESEE